MIYTIVIDYDPLVKGRTESLNHPGFSYITVRKDDISDLPAPDGINSDDLLYGPAKLLHELGHAIIVGFDLPAAKAYKREVSNPFLKAIGISTNKGPRAKLDNEIAAWDLGQALFDESRRFALGSYQSTEQYLDPKLVAAAEALFQPKGTSCPSPENSSPMPSQQELTSPKPFVKYSKKKKALSLTRTKSRNSKPKSTASPK